MAFRTVPVVFGRGVPNWGSGGMDPLAGSRGSAPCGGQGAKPPEAEDILKFGNDEIKFPRIIYLQMISVTFIIFIRN